MMSRKLVVAAELVLALEWLVDRQRPGGTAFDLDRHAQEADRRRSPGRPKAGRSGSENPARPQVGNDPRPAGRDHVSGDAFAQRVLAAFDFVGSHSDCRFCAQPAGRLVQQDQAPRGAYLVCPK